jgi:uncharacterized protein (DUF488 family)
VGPSLNKLDLVRLLFLLAEEAPELPRTAKHEFVPYRKGPYSFTLAYDLTAMEREGLVTQNPRSVKLTTLGHSQANGVDDHLATAIADVSRRHSTKSTAELLDHVYATYPWFTINSRLVDRRAFARPEAQIAVYTTSYEGVTLDGLLNRLIKAGIRRLIDVRANPVARRFGFHKSTMARICPKLGIEYIHIPEVGVPSEWRSDLDTVTAYEALFVRYKNEVLFDQDATLQILQKLIQEEPSAMMCKEADPRCCHRTILALALSKRMGLPVQDLREEVLGGLF